MYEELFFLHFIKEWNYLISNLCVNARQGLLIQMDGTLDFVNANWGRILNSNIATQTHSIFVKL